MATQDFIKLVAPGAQEVQRVRKMFASVTIAQAIWETGSGTHTPSDIVTGAESYNLFGRKAANGDPFVKSYTWEVDHGVRINIIAKFKKFNSYEESVLDRSEFLKLPWYQRACNATNAFDAAKYLIDTGMPGYSYATDPNYVNGITGVMRTYNLTQYDVKLVPEDEENMAMNLPTYAWDTILAVYGKAYNDKIITSYSWIQKIKDKTLTAAELGFLKTVIDARKDGVVVGDVEPNQV